MKYFIIAFLIVLLFSCQKEDELVKVKYRLGKAYSTTYIAYRDDKGKMQKDTLLFMSGEDTKTYSLNKRRGDIVYLSALYTDSLSSILLEILLDEKVYKSTLSNNEAGKYVIVSGTIP